MIHVLKLIISGLLNLGVAALIPIGLFVWAIWFFVRLYFSENKRINKKYREDVKSEKEWLKTKNEALIKLGINPKEFNQLSTEEKMSFWDSLPEDKLRELGLGTEKPTE